MAELHINYSQNGSPYMLDFQQNEVSIKTIFVPVSPDGSVSFQDSVTDGTYDIIVYNLGKNPCVLVSNFFTYMNGEASPRQLRKSRGIFNGRKLKHTATPINDNCYLTFGGNGYGGKNPVSWKVMMYKGQKGYFKLGASAVAKRPTLKIDASVAVALD